MASPASREGSNELPRVRVRVHRVDEGETWIIRFRDYNPLGCLTHYVKGVGSVYCGPSCTKPIHNLPHMWKGYAPADYWDDERNLWIPCCFEITEGLEHYLRGKCQRGQVWEVKRFKPEGKKKKGPVSGRLLEERDPETCPEPFDLDETLFALYHSPVSLTKPNPVPLKPELAVSDDAPPAKVVAQRLDNTPPTTTDDQRQRQRIEAIRIGLIPRGRYPELDRIAFGHDPAAGKNGKPPTNGTY